MFTDEDRAQTRAHLIRAAADDARLTAAALVGSAASTTQDQWSDIDLAFEVAPDQHLGTVAEVWSSWMYTDHGAVAHLDVWDGPALYRVFVLPSTLQVDLSFWPAGALEPTDAAFQWLVDRTGASRSSGPSSFAPTSEAAPQSCERQGRTTAPPLDMSWLYAIHARSSIARGRRLQALHMLNQMRDHVATAACERLHLPSAHGRGVDDLPVALRQQLLDTVARDMTAAELTRCLQRLGELLLRELAVEDPDKARALSGVIEELVQTAVHVRGAGTTGTSTPTTEG